MMLKGTSRRIIHVKNTGSPYFEEAYFVVSPSCAGGKSDEGMMIREASRIVEESLLSEQISPRGRKKPASKLLTAATFLSGAAVCAAVMLMFLL